MVPWVVLQCVIVAFPGHTHLLFSVRLSDWLRPRFMFGLEFDSGLGYSLVRLFEVM